MTAPARLILVHKQRTSAMVRFLRYVDGIVAPEPFPKLSQVLGEDEQHRDEAKVGHVVAHPSMLVNQAAARLGLDQGEIAVETDFLSSVDTPDGVSAIYLGRITTIDPPFDAADKIDARFINITEARDMSPSELELLRRAYLCVME